MAAPQQAPLKNARVELRIQNMCCQTCALAIERVLKKLPGVRAVTASYLFDKTYVDYDSTMVTVDQIETVIKKTGYRVSKRG